MKSLRGDNTVHKIYLLGTNCRTQQGVSDRKSSGELHKQLQITYGYDVSPSTLIQTPACIYMLLFSPTDRLGQKTRGNNRKVISGSDTITAVRNKLLLDCCFLSISAPKKAITNNASM